MTLLLEVLAFVALLLFQSEMEVNIRDRKGEGYTRDYLFTR
jgi:hypothetical protein